MELPFERAALRGDPMPEGMALYEQAAFQALRGLYALYRRGGISREDAAREKEKILEAYRQEEADWARSREITRPTPVCGKTSRLLPIATAGNGPWTMPMPLYGRCMGRG